MQDSFTAWSKILISSKMLIGNTDFLTRSFSYRKKHQYQKPPAKNFLSSTVGFSTIKPKNINRWSLSSFIFVYKPVLNLSLNGWLNSLKNMIEDLTGKILFKPWLSNTRQICLTDPISGRSLRRGASSPWSGERMERGKKKNKKRFPFRGPPVSAWTQRPSPWSSKRILSLLKNK